MSGLRNLADSVRIADIIDIVVVAGFVYAAITWMRRARSRFVMGGFAALVALYLSARLLNMYLTLFLFQAGITVALVALVVIFQEDIRRAFERIAVSRLLGHRPPAASAELIAVVAESCATLAQSKIGALVVIRGKEPLERHMSSGVRLEGRPSAALFYSIFDPSSPGHDGALIIEQGLISKFGVQLPLSTQPREGYGTRHAAALGLSERSDALVVVVSEERGIVSIARGGRLEIIDSVAELKQRLTAFLQEVSPERTKRWYERYFTSNPGTKILSLAIAIAAWVIVFGYTGETLGRTYHLPIVYRNIPEGWLIEEPNPNAARVTLSGSARAFQLLDPATLTIGIDADKLSPGVKPVRLSENNIALPAGLVVDGIEPQEVLVEVQRTAMVELEVQADLVGQLARGLSLVRTRVSPGRVRLLVRLADRDKLRSITTDPIDLSEVHETTTLRRSLVVPRLTRLATGQPKEAIVTLELRAD